MEAEYKERKFIYALILEAYVISQVEYYPRRLDLGDVTLGKNIEAYIYIKFPEEVTDLENIKISTTEQVSYKLALSRDKKMVRVTFFFNIIQKGIVEEIIYIAIPRQSEAQEFYIPICGFAL
ncbi:MAG: hypothetical protein N2246_04185 [Candidatus Sumerlaeia bacterium]|nr:hypothetical protein [Candidatus Sumerlaeia bacterium]